MTSSWMSVESTSMTTSRLAAAVQAAALDGDVEAEPRTPQGEDGPERSGSAPETANSIAVTG